MADDEPGPGAYASPPCYAHELDPLQREFAATAGEDVKRWRRAERERLYALRDSLSPERRAHQQARISAALEQLLAELGMHRVGAYWPIRGEPDLRPLMRRLDAAGVALALPVIRGDPGRIEYSAWRNGAAMRRGRWGIAEPADDAPIEPQLVIAPLVGVDRERYRLGNGGGYFDRYLAACRQRPIAVGAGFSTARIDTIYPQAHDIPMDRVIVGADA